MSSSIKIKKKRRKEYRYGCVALSKPHCPCCGESLNFLSSEECPDCRFSMTVLLPQFPFAAPKLETVSDFASMLTSVERSFYERCFTKISKKYPQFNFVLCFCDVEERLDLREFGFWLLNSSVTAHRQGEERPESKVLIIYDVRQKRLSVTKGYGVEAYLPDAVLKESLQGFHQSLLRGEHKGAANEIRRAFLKMLGQSRKEIGRKKLKR